MMGTEHDDVRPGGARIPHPVTVPQAGRDSTRAMDIQLGSERIFVLRERDSEDQFRQQAMDHRSQSFGSGLGSLLQRPKAEDIVLLNSQRRPELLVPGGSIAVKVARAALDKSY